MRGELLVMGALGALAALGRRGGRAADSYADWSQRRRLRYLAILNKHLTGQVFDDLEWDWICEHENMTGSLLVYPRKGLADGPYWDLYATPGHGGEDQMLHIQITKSYPAENSMWCGRIATSRVTIAGRRELWTGNLATDAEQWKDLIRPMLTQIERNPTMVEYPGMDRC